MAIEIYQGVHVTAESATNYIDIGTISSGCEQINEAAAQYTNVGKELSAAAGNLSADALSVNETTMQASVEDCGNQICSINAKLSSFASSILDATNRALDKKQLELNQIAEAKDQAIIAELAAREAANETNN